MDSNEAGRLCEKLFKLVDSGPGKDPEALREVVGIVTTLKRAAARYPRGKLTELEAGIHPLVHRQRVAHRYRWRGKATSVFPRIGHNRGAEFMESPSELIAVLNAGNAAADGSP